MRWKVATIVLGAAFVLIVGGVVVYARLDRPPAGYQLWHGLPVPEYFSKVDERSSQEQVDGATRTCTAARFDHGLSETSTVEREMQYHWRQRGFTLKTTMLLGGSIFRGPSDRQVWQLWFSGNVVRPAYLTIVDCPMP